MTEPADRWRTVTYRSADDRLNLFARDYPGEEGTPALPLLLMHGLTRNSADFEPLVAALDFNRRIIVPDQRGRGRSENDPLPENYLPNIYVEDMWALLDGLSIDRVILIGTSLGGLMAMLMGVQKPERVAGIVLNDVGPELQEEGLDRIRSFVGDSGPMSGWGAAAQACEAINGVAMEGFAPEDWMAFAKRTCIELPDGQVAFAYDPQISVGIVSDEPATIPPDPWLLWDALSDIPVAVIRGATSDILGQEAVVEMARRHSAYFSHCEVPGRGHAPLLDEPVAVAAIVELLARTG